MRFIFGEFLDLEKKTAQELLLNSIERSENMQCSI